MFYGLATALKLQSARNGLPNVLRGVLPADFNLFKVSRNRLSFLMKKSRQEFHFISENSANQQKMFTISKKLLNMQEVNDNLFLKLSNSERRKNKFVCLIFFSLSLNHEVLSVRSVGTYNFFDSCKINW